MSGALLALGRAFGPLSENSKTSMAAVWKLSTIEDFTTGAAEAQSLLVG
jgi:hypothetical protein